MNSRSNSSWPVHPEGLVLAGGRGTRMGGQDKGWLPLQGRPMIEHVLRRFAPQVARVVISANRNLDRYRALGCDVVADDATRFGAYPGPLGGIAQGMAATQALWLAVVPCDTPFLPVDLVARLSSMIGSAPAAAAWTEGRMQPLFCLLRTDLRSALEEALSRGERKPANFLQSIGAAAVPFEDAHPFANLNTPDDLPG